MSYLRRTCVLVQPVSRPLLGRRDAPTTAPTPTLQQKRSAMAVPTAPRVFQVGISSELATTARGGAVGFMTGFLGSMAGIGGGPFCVPLLAALLKLPHKQCVGMSLVCTASTLAAGSVSTFATSTVSVAVGPILVLGGVAPFVGYSMSKYSSRLNPKVLKKLFAIFLMGCCAIMISRVVGTPAADGEPNALARFVNNTAYGSVVFHSVLGVACGCASGLLGIGGGVFLVPVMAVADVAPFPTITSTAMLAILPTALASCTAHYRMGNVITRLIPSLCAGTFAGASLGPRMLAGCDEDQRKLVCAGILAFTSLLMLR